MECIYIFISCGWLREDSEKSGSTWIMIQELSTPPLPKSLDVDFFEDLAGESSVNVLLLLNIVEASLNLFGAPEPRPIINPCNLSAKMSVQL